MDFSVVSQKYVLINVISNEGRNLNKLMSYKISPAVYPALDAGVEMTSYLWDTTLEDENLPIENYSHRLSLHG